MSATLQDALNQGARLLQAGEVAEAQKLADALVRQFPETTAVRLFAADAANMTGDVSAAIASLDAVPDSAEDYPAAALKKARLHFSDGRRADALRLAEEVAGLIGQQPVFMHVLAGILRDCQQADTAHEWLKKALELAPGDISMLYDIAVLEYHLNRPQDAEAHITELLREAPFHAPALHLRSALRTQSDEQNHVDDLRRRIAEGPSHPGFIAGANYALAKELEDLGQYDDAITALDTGARAYRSTLHYESDAEVSSHEEIRSVFSAETMKTLAPGYGEERPIFVVGMPRSGTTLVERMLSCHSKLVSIGEFTEFPRLYSIGLQEQYARDPNRTPTAASLDIDFAKLGRAYCHAARELAGDAPVFIDKLPYNFLYCGYILAALPKARIIHLRRDPLDTCYAVYKTLFYGAYSFSYDLDELADYFISYYRHMAHWRDVLPDRILDVSYEALAREPEVEMQKVVDWCELPWEASVLEFHQRDEASMTASAMQVRRPVYTDSIGSWRRAEARLAALKSRFEAENIV